VQKLEEKLKWSNIYEDSRKRKHKENKENYKIKQQSKRL
jgi:hypothetical protein